MADLDIRPIRADEVHAILDMLAPWETRAFFERFFYADPAFEPGHVCAAFDGPRPVSCAQILPKTVRVVGGPAAVAGIGQVWTEPDYRRRGIAPRVLRACIDVMERERFALSLLFASRFDFYAALGWMQYPRRRASVVAWPEPPAEVRIRPFDRHRDLAAVRELYDAYTKDICGVTVRGDDEWEGSLRMAGHPSETFLVAEGDAGLTAYMRATGEDVYTAMEYAYAPAGEDALAALLCVQAASTDLGFVMVDLAHDAPLQAHLEAREFQLNEIDDPFAMWRVVDRGALPPPFNGPAAPADDRELLQALLPPETYTYWLSDRF